MGEFHFFLIISSVFNLIFLADINDSPIKKPSAPWLVKSISCLLLSKPLSHNLIIPLGIAFDSLVNIFKSILSVLRFLLFIPIQLTLF